MDNPGAFFSSDAGKILAMREQRVHQSVLLMPRARMHDEPGRLVEHEQIVIFEKDFELHLLRPRFDFLDLRLAQFHEIPVRTRSRGRGGFPLSLRTRRG